MTSIRIRGASEHNLKGVSLDIPRDALTVFTGISGSGKSSLAFDTVYREGQRRFLESLSAYARQFLGGMEKPRVESIDGLSPTVSIDQKTVGRSPRSTVGTMTEIQDHLRLLYSRVGKPHCPRCGKPVASQSPQQICDRVFHRFEGWTGLVLAPLVRGRKGEHRILFEDLRRDGYTRVRVDGKILRLDAGLPRLSRHESHTVEVVRDRLEVRDDLRGRWTEAIEKSVELAGGLVTVVASPRGPGGEAAGAGGEAVPADVEETFSSRFACPGCGVDLPEMEPRLFSFNSPHGSCPVCLGLGRVIAVDPDLVVRDPSAPLRKGGLDVLRKSGRFVDDALDPEGFRALRKKHGFTVDSSWGDLGEEARRELLHGSTGYEGLVPILRRLARMGKAWARAYEGELPCHECGGSRLRADARAVRLGEGWEGGGPGKGIHELAAMPVAALRGWLEGLRAPAGEGFVADPILKHILSRLRYIENVGLGYLTLERRSESLAGGEAQRLRLASQVGAGLQGVLFVLDEPSIGLHARDNEKLLETLSALRDSGNTVLVVEHDEATMRAADHLVDVGPGAGSQGGEIVAQGGLSDIEDAPGSITGQYLTGARAIPVPASRRPTGDRYLELLRVEHNNLKGIDLRIPLGVLVAVTGVSGSGKSSLVNGVLRPALLKKLGLSSGLTAGKHSMLRGHQFLDKLIDIDQSPIGKTPRSNPATYVKVFDPIRDLFAMVPESRARGYTRGRFSFNKDGGRCMECGGGGVTVVDMQFLAPVEVTCDICGGRRYNRETLEIRYKGKNIHDVLDMTIEAAAELFADHPRIRQPLSALVQVGLGYMKLGQPSTTLSGGEAQRVKLASELRRRDTGRTLYIFDEPTTGLHFEDVRALVEAIQQLVSRGNSVIVIEHNLDVIKTADHVIDLGPEAGDHGGRIVAQGTPEELARVEESHTGRFLAPVLARARGGKKRAARPSSPAGRGRSTRPARREAETRAIEVIGATRHNLRSVSVRIPRERLTVVTGVSGSGKTSLAFDTVFAEGQRRYLESLSTYARRFLGRLEAAEVERIDGLSPAIAIDQRSASANPRSTVGTITEIHDYLRLLYARVGAPHCPICGEPLAWTSPSRLASDLVRAIPGEKLMVLAPIGLDANGDEPRPHTETFVLRSPQEIESFRAQLLKSGYTRILAGGKEVRLDEEQSGPSRRILAALREWREREGPGVEGGSEANGGGVARAPLLVVVDRIVAGETSRTRLAGSLETAFQRGGGTAAVMLEGSKVVFHTRVPSCPRGHVTFEEELTPRMFSFSSHQGACLRCKGVGVEHAADPDLLFPKPGRPFFEGMDPELRSFLFQQRPSAAALLQEILRTRGADRDTEFGDLEPAVQDIVLRGSGQKIELELVGGLRFDAGWPGLVPLVEKWALESESASEGPDLSKFLRPRTCTECGGGRLRRESLAVRVGGLNIHEISRRTAREATAFLEGLRFGERESQIAAPVLAEIGNRLRFLEEVGLGYLSLDRGAATLSGGEAQRIRLASQLGNRLSGVLYVLDEPTVGLHQRDTERLMASLRGLQALGNTILMVEHDREAMRSADWIIDMGPGGGAHGGRVVAEGTPDAVARHPESLTGRYLRGGGDEERGVRPGRSPSGWIELEGVRHNNLKDLSVRFPLGMFTAVTGVSGSGKSSLVIDVLAPSVEAGIRKSVARGRVRAARGLEGVRRLVVVDQLPIGRSPRSNPATYTGIWDHVRALYAETPAAKVRGFDASRFSFNTGTGRCLACEGQGARQVEMHFLSDVWVPCEECGGKRYDRETLKILYKGLSVGDVLELEVDQALGALENHPAIRRILETLSRVGLGYVKLGQASNTLSGGEAQRVKLASELVTRVGGGSFYILDEPTTGLHHEDVKKLIGVLQGLVEGGNTLVVIEHQLDVIRAADWVIDLGPEAGDEGGQVVAVGTPEEIARSPESRTGRYLG